MQALSSSETQILPPRLIVVNLFLEVKKKRIERAFLVPTN